MTDATADAPAEDEGTPPKKGSKLPLLIGLVLALAGGGGGFFAAWSGLLPFGGSDPAETSHGDGAQGEGHGDGHAADPPLPMPDTDVAFVELPPLTISMGTMANLHHLRFRASLEVPPQYASEVETLAPRVLDVLNSYLRALQPEDIEAPGALIRLRSQMLRRLQMVAGEDRVSDLLVLEFVLN